jgi:hypothetical protein
MSNELRTQGTELWYVSGPTAVTKVGNITAFGDFGKQANDLPTTNLDSTAVEKIPGLPDNGDATLTINVDPSSAAHAYLNSIAGTATRVEFCIGYSDGTTPPTALASAIVQPVAANRTSDKFLAGVKSFRKSVGVDSIVSVSVALSISGAITTVWKTP